MADDNESGGNPVLWTREDGDCTYNFTGAANAEITILNGIKIKLNANGQASYTAKDAKTNCTFGGEEQCTARYCPTIPGSS